MSHPYSAPIVCCAFPVVVPSVEALAHNGDMPVDSTKTVNDIIAYWRATKRHTYTSRSYASKNYYAEIFGLDLGERLAETITVADVLEWYTTKPSERWAEALGKRKRKRVWCKGTKLNVARTIITMFHLAERHGLIERHRLKALVENFEHGDQRRALTEDEYRLMIDHATDDLWRHYIEFMRETACRPGEAASLRWGMIDWDGGFCLLREHKTAKKTGKPRIIPLSDRAVELLCELEAQARDRASGADPTGYVFRNERGDKWTSQSCTKRLETIRKRSGLASDAKLHGIRKLAISHWAAMGMPIKLASVIAGHSDTKITEAVYAKFDNFVPQLREAMREFR